MSSTGIYYNIDTNGGQSGCPVYMSGDNSQLVGIHKGYNPKRHLNFATMITESVIIVLKVWIEEMGIISNFMNPLPKALMSEIIKESDIEIIGSPK